MKQLFTFVLILAIGVAKAQNYQSVEDVNSACTQLGFMSNEQAEIAVDAILAQIGLSRNFIIVECPEINNAVAKNIKDSNGDFERYILYDNNFFKNINKGASSDWAATSILAHEIGHHLSGHSLNNKGSNHKWELEADQFSGFILAKMGASLAEAQSALNTLKYEKATATHPAKADRLARVQQGWVNAMGGKQDDNYEPVEDIPLTIIENLPVFPGCSGSNDELKNCLQKGIQDIIVNNFDLNLPGKLQLTGDKVRIMMFFTINKFGYISNVSARAPANELEAEAIRVMRLLPKMKPGNQRGRDVGVKYQFPLTINLE